MSVDTLLRSLPLHLATAIAAVTALCIGTVAAGADPRSLAIAGAIE